jgi:5-keto 4-deoxyuronate isomerase
MCVNSLHKYVAGSHTSWRQKITKMKMNVKLKFGKSEKSKNRSVTKGDATGVVDTASLLAQLMMKIS